MKRILFLAAYFFVVVFYGSGQTINSYKCPSVVVEFHLAKDKFKFNEIISFVITLRNISKTIQYVYWDYPKSSLGCPAFTGVKLIKKNTGESVIKFDSKAILESQSLPEEKIRDYSYKLKPGEFISGKYNLLEFVVLKTEKEVLQKGIYTMQVIYCENESVNVNFTVE